MLVSDLVKTEVQRLNIVRARHGIEKNITRSARNSSPKLNRIHDVVLKIRSRLHVDLFFIAVFSRNIAR